MNGRFAGAAICAALVWQGASAGGAGDEYAWALFMAINRAAAAGAGAADGPVVWETWATASDLFRADGADPGPWNERSANGESATAGPAAAGLGAAVAATAARFDTPSRKSFEHPLHIVNGRMQPVADVIGGTERLTEIRFNSVSFDYIRAEGLYSLDGQLQRYAQRQAVSFPRGAIDVKARWRVIDDAERSRYHTLRVASDGVVRLYGLTALHIASKSRPNWFWATFEHVDNPSLPGNEGWQLPSNDTFACGGEHPGCNEAPHGIGLEGTVWQNYRLRGSMTDFVDAANQPVRLANSELERGMQQTASCITCHSRASVGLADGQPVRLAILDQRGGAPVEPRRGYIGSPAPGWFGTGGADARPVFQPLDFVWSLSQAQARPQRRDPHPPVEPGDSP